MRKKICLFSVLLLAAQIAFPTIIPASAAEEPFTVTSNRIGKFGGFDYESLLFQ